MSLVLKGGQRAVALASLLVGLLFSSHDGLKISGPLQLISNHHTLGFDQRSVHIADSDHALTIKFLGANSVAPEAMSGKVSYKNIWNGVTLVYAKDDTAILESTYYIAPQAVGQEDPVGSIQLAYNVPVVLDKSGHLVLAFPTGAMIESPPVAWQEINSEKIPVNATFRAIGEKEIGFSVGSYDRRYPLIIDPTLGWNTFLGGTGQHLGYGIAVDSSGNVYTVGLHNTNWTTALFGSPIGSVGFQGGASDGVVTKLNSSGSVLWYRFFGGTSNDALSGVKVDSSGNIYVIGYAFGAYTNLGNSPIHSYVGGDIDIYVAKLNSSGTIVWDTYLGSTSNDYAYGIALDTSGNVYIGGESYHVWDSSFNNVQGSNKSSDGYEGYIAKLNSNGVYQWHRYLGGYGVQDVATDTSGNVYPVHSIWNSGNYDTKVYKVTSSGAQTWASTFGSSGGADQGNGIAVDSSGNVFVSGVSSATWGTPVRAYSSGNDAFVAKLNSSGTLQWNSFLGGTGNDNCRSSNNCTMALDSAGNIYTSGYSTVTWGSPSIAFGGGTSDGFVVMLNPNGSLGWNLFTGGSNADQNIALAASSAGDLYLTGYSQTTAWGSPIKSPAFFYGQNVTKISNSVTLTISKSGSGTGSVTSAPGTLSCGSTCSQAFATSSTVVLTATADSGSVFSGWSGGGCSGTSTCTPSLSSNTTVSATFAPGTFTMTTSTSGTGTGSIASSPSGISCGSDCTEDFTSGTSVTLTATQGAGSVFAGWGGTAGCSGTGTCTLTMSAAKSVTATFTLDGYSVTVIKSGTGSGTVTSSPSGVSCGSTCSSSYDYGTSVTLTATAGSDSVFAGWGSGCSGTGTCTLTVDTAKSVSAAFNLKTYAVTVTKSGGGSGTVTSSVSGINCGSVCTANFNTGTSVTLTATAASGSSFVGWSGGGCSGTGTCTVTVSESKSVIAGLVSSMTAYQTYMPNMSTYTLGVAKSGSGTGTVTSSPAGISCGATCTKNYNGGSFVTLVASAASGSTFSGWSGGVCSGTGVCTVSIMANKLVSAAFTKSSGASSTIVINDIAGFSMGCTPGQLCTMPTWTTSTTANSGVSSAYWQEVGGGSLSLTSAGKVDLVNSRPARGTYYVQYVATDGTATTASEPIALSIPNNAPVLAKSGDLAITGASLQNAKYQFSKFERKVDIKAAFTDYDGDNLSYSWSVKDLDTKKAGFISTTTGASELRARVAGNVTVTVVTDDGNGGVVSQDIVVNIPVPDITPDDLNVKITTFEADSEKTMTVGGTLQSSVWPDPIINGTTPATVTLLPAATSPSLSLKNMTVAGSKNETVDVQSDTDTYSFMASGVPVGTDPAKIDVAVYTSVDNSNVFLTTKSIVVDGTGASGATDADTGGDLSAGDGGFGPLSISASGGCSLIDHGSQPETSSLWMLLVLSLLLGTAKVMYAMVHR